MGQPAGGTKVHTYRKELHCPSLYIYNSYIHTITGTYLKLIHVHTVLPRPGHKWHNFTHYEQHKHFKKGPSLPVIIDVCGVSCRSAERAGYGKVAETTGWHQRAVEKHRSH